MLLLWELLSLTSPAVRQCCGVPDSKCSWWGLPGQRMTWQNSTGARTQRTCIRWNLRVIVMWLLQFNVGLPSLLFLYRLVRTPGCCNVLLLLILIDCTIEITLPPQAAHLLLCCYEINDKMQRVSFGRIYKTCCGKQTALLGGRKQKGERNRCNASQCVFIKVGDYYYVMCAYS